MAKWTAFPHAGEFSHDSAAIKKLWTRLHAGDMEPCPKDAGLLAAWAQFHNGEFQAAAEAGLKLGGGGITLANKATSIYANYLEKKEKTRLELFTLVAERAVEQVVREPDNVNAWYW